MWERANTAITRRGSAPRNGSESRARRTRRAPGMQSRYKLPSQFSSINTIVVATMGEGPFWFLTLAITLVQYQYCSVHTLWTTTCVTVLFLESSASYTQPPCTQPPFEQLDSVSALAICLHLGHLGDLEQAVTSLHSLYILLVHPLN